MKRDYTAVVAPPADEDYPDARYLVHVKASGPAEAAYKARLKAEFKDRGHREGQDMGANMDYDILYMFEGKLKNLQTKGKKKL